MGEEGVENGSEETINAFKVKCKLKNIQAMLFTLLLSQGALKPRNEAPRETTPKILFKVNPNPS